MNAFIQAIRGMNDILPPQTQYWSSMEHQLKQLAKNYGYQEIRFPIVEQTALFKRGIGDATDIVEKEMYTFEDRNGNSLTLRPEGTAACVRAGIEHGLFHHQMQRLWYLGPMFRHERPQKGRYRQFYQYGVEAFGMSGPEIEAELIFMSARIWDALGLDDVHLQINSLGSMNARMEYRQKLTEYFSQHWDFLDEDSRRRLSVNPLRILDSKNPELQELIAQAPVLTDHLDQDSQKDFEQLQVLLQKAKINYQVNPRLVRGLDYYNGLVFEWVTDQLGAQSAVCSGGRFDGLVELLGGKPTPAVGFAAGLERIAALLAIQPALEQSTDVYVLLLGDQAKSEGLLWVEQWRREAPDLRFWVDSSNSAMKTQLKRADKSGASFAFILGEEEMSSHQVTIKNLRENQPQMRVSHTAVFSHLVTHTRKQSL